MGINQVIQPNAVVPPQVTNPAIMPSALNLTPNSQQANSLINKLLEKGFIDQVKYNEIKVKALNTGKTIEEVITAGNYITEKQLYMLKSELFNVPFIDLQEVTIAIDVIGRINQDMARKNLAVAFEETPELIKLAMEDPLDIQKVKFLRTLLGKRVEPYFADPDSIKEIIETRYGTQIGNEEVSEALEDVGEVVDIGNTLSETEDLQVEITSAPVARIVNMILEFAAKHKASDVHIEPRENKIAVRYRVSGVLTEKLILPKKLGSAVVSRIKILSNLKIDEHRVPQDGRFQIKSDSEYIDLRVSIMPAVYGEKVVIRLLEKGGASINIKDTGIRGRAHDLYLEALKKTQGIVLVTGPTGSGKTVTLAASLKILNRPEVNIMTLEDPVEIRIDGVTQVQVNADVGLTFAKGLRSFLRQDPDIIMVGEIRDRETAELAVQASLTGHLVLATLHTNSATGAIPRLTDMKVEPFLLASTVNLITAQRLTRKICEHCLYTVEATPEQLNAIRDVLSGVKGFNFDSYLANNGGHIILNQGKGCPNCSDSGYKGRIGIFEVFKMSEKIGAMTISHESAGVIEKQAIEEGMTTMLQDGYFKVLEGATTMEEVLRVIN
ncbi:MAG: ATPase, T2SS/T4P/T4SS family [bacterium]